MVWTTQHCCICKRERERDPERQRERRRGERAARDQHIQSPEGSREGKDAADEEQRGIHEERERPACSSDWGWGAEREGGAAQTDVRAQPPCL